MATYTLILPSLITFGALTNAAVFFIFGDFIFGWLLSELVAVIVSLHIVMVTLECH